MNRRDQLLATAIRLFRSHGYQATGIDKILSESGVSKPTLYRHFESKDALIVASLKVWDVECRAKLIGAIAARGTTPRERLLALFDVLQEWFEAPDFEGSMFIKAMVEFTRQSNPIHQVAAEHKRAFAAQIRDIVALGGAGHPEETTAALMLLMEGATVTAQTFGDGQSARQAKAIAQDVLNQAGVV